MNPPRAFISYSGDDRRFAEKLAGDLRDRGVDAWFDGWEMEPGDSIRRKIEEGLQKCEFFVLVLSRSSVKRPWVQKELDVAADKLMGGSYKKIIPVVIDDCEKPPFVASLRCIDMHQGNYGEGLDSLTRSIFGVKEKPPLGKPPSAVPEGDEIDAMFERWGEWQRVACLKLLHEELNDRPLRFVGARLLSEAWDGFRITPRWDTDVRQKILDLKREVSRMPSLRGNVLRLTGQFDAVHWDDPYPTLMAALRQAAPSMLMGSCVRQINAQMNPKEGAGINRDEFFDLVAVKRLLSAIRTQIHEPALARCFLLMGSFGSGKTHFIAELLSHEQPPDRALVLPLRPDVCHNSIDDAVTLTLRQATAIEWQSDEECFTCIEPKCAKADLPIFIVLDDFQDFLLLRESFLQELRDYVGRRTLHRHVRWIIALDDSEYDRVSAHSDFFEQYSRVKRTRLRGWGASPFGERAPGEPRLGDGWWLLDRMNAESSLGLKIIHESLEEKPAALNAVQQDRLEQGDTLNTEVASNPLIAWTFVDLSDRIPIEQVTDLNYIEFVTSYWEQRCRSLRSVVAHPLPLEQGIDHVAEAVLKLGTLGPAALELTTSIVRDAEGKSEFADGELASAVLDALIQLGFIRKSYDSDALANKLTLTFEPFWALHVSRRLVARQSWPLEKEKLRSELHSSLDQCSYHHHFKQSMYQFLLLVLDIRASGRGETLPPGLFSIGESPADILPPAAIWHAAPKARNYLCKQVVAESQRSSFRPKRVGDLFACLHFLACLHNVNARPHERLQILRRQYEELAKHHLANYFVFLAGTCFRDTEDPEQLVSHLAFFHGCEDITIAHAYHSEQAAAVVAHLAVYRLFELLPSQYDKIVQLVMGYLHKNSEGCHMHTVEENGRRQWRRYFFREWVMFELAHQMTDELDCKSFDVLYNSGWFDKSLIRHRSSVPIEMEREATIALGFWYRTRRRRRLEWEDEYDDDMEDDYDEDTEDEYDEDMEDDYDTGSSDESDEDCKNPFEKLVERLAASPRKNDRELAFFLIYHTVPTSEDKDSVVAKAFHDVLVQLSRDEELNWLHNRFSRFFRANLNRWRD